MIAPRIHLNGTGKQDLLNHIRGTVECIDTALTALRAVSPHGRDYYVISPDAITRAIAEHTSRVERLRAVHDELVAVWHAIEAGEVETDPPDPR